MKLTHSSLIITIVIVFFLIPVQVLSFENEMLTYADFNYVRYITTSISHVYFTTTEGIIRYNKMDMRWEEPLTGGEGIDNRDIYRIWVDQFDEKLFVQTSDSYYEYELLFDRWYPINELPSIDKNYTHVQLQTIMYPPAGYNYSSEGYLIDPFGRDFLFTDIIDDLSGRSWMGTWGYGAAVSGSSSGIIDLIPYGLIQNHVKTIYNDNGILLIAGALDLSARSGVTIFDPDENNFSYIESGIDFGFPRDDINCLEADDEYIYIGSNAGLFLWNRERNEIEKKVTKSYGLPDDIVLSLSRIGDSILVGTTEGLCYISSRGDSLGYIRPDRFINNEIYDFELTDSTVWIAASTGVYQLHLKSNQLQKFQDPHLIVFDRAFKIERYENKLWFASDAGFVYLDLKTGNTRPFPSITRGYTNRALAVNDVIAAVASELGFKIIYHNNPKHPVEREFTIGDGLPSDNINALLLDGDYLWIGSDKGLSMFLWNDPDRID